MDWREEIDCEQCKAWTGQDPIPLEEGRRMLQEEGVDPQSFRLIHACHVGIDSHGKAYHMPSTVMIMDNGTRVQWLPETPR